MRGDPSVIAALESALEQAPDDVAVRLHLAGLLLEAERPADAGGHARHVLARDPARIDALEVAARAARALGDTNAADGYERLLGALGRPTSEPPPPPTAPTAEPATAEDLATSAEIDAFLHNALADPDVEDPGITLADVGGLADVKEQLTRSFIAPMRNPELREMYGKSLRGGLLLYGPPGCGKTFLARAVAGELGARFYAIGLHEVLDMWLGQSERNLHDAFETARANTPCVMFLDEIDALGHKRSNLARSAGRNVVVQLLTELDGLQEQNEGLFVLAATNQPWDLDPALRRPGRLDRTILVLPPDAPARSKIIAYHLSERPVGTIDIDRIAQRTDGFSGADLRLVCESAAEHALEDSIRSGKARPIGMADVEAALTGITPSTRAWFDIARNFVMFASQSGEYDDLLAYMRKHKLT